MEISGEVNIIGCDDDPTFMFKFHFSNDDSITSSVIEEPYIVSRDQWTKFIQALKDNETMTLRFYQGNGYGNLTTENGQLQYEVMPSGAGGDLSLHFRLRSKHRDTMVKLLTEMINHPNTMCMKW